MNCHRELCFACPLVVKQGNHWPPPQRRSFLHLFDAIIQKAQHVLWNVPIYFIFCQKLIHIKNTYYFAQY